MNNIYAELYRGRLGKYRWRVKNVQNGKNMANGSQGYRHRIDAVHGMQEVLGLGVTHSKTADGESVSFYTRNGYTFGVVDLT